MFFNFAKRLWQPKSLRRSSRRPRVARLSLEHLEDRLVPSTFEVSVVSPSTNNNLLQFPTASSGEGFTPAQIQHAYGFDKITLSNGNAGNGSGETIAIIEASVDPNVVGDANYFSRAYNLPQFNSANGPILQQVALTDSSTGQTSEVGASGNDEVETALDVEWAHAIAPQANILVVDAPVQLNADGSWNDSTAMYQAAQWAATQPDGTWASSIPSNQPVTVVSMSFGGWAPSGNGTVDDADFIQAGVTFVASGGDNGVFTYPGSSPNVLAVGGTSLKLDASGNYLSETIWNDGNPTENNDGYATGTSPEESGGGPDPLYNPSKLGPNVGYNADPRTGFAVYDSYDPDNYLSQHGAYVPNHPGWIDDGGNSAGAPQWAALIAIADQGRALEGQGSLSGSQTLNMIGTPSNQPNMDLFDFHSAANISGEIMSPDSGLTYSGSQVVGQGTPIANELVPDLVYGAAPTAPSLTATPVSSSEIDLRWSSVTDAHSYTLEKWDSSTSSWDVLSTSTGGGSYAATGLQPGTSYNFRVVASNGLGSGSTSTFATTLPAAPATPTGLSAQPVSTSEIDLTWNSDPGATSYTVEWSGNGSSGSESTSNLFCDVTGLQSGTTYSFQISASNAGGSSAYSAPLSAATELATPTGLTANAVSSNQIDLSWNSDPGAIGYTVEWNGNGSSGFESTSNLFCDVTGLQSGTAYSFQILASNAAGSSAFSPPVSDTTLTTAPTGLTATASGSQINLTWSVVSGASSYNIYRIANGSNGFAQINTTPVSGITFSDSGLSAGTTYYYEVSAVDAGGESALSGSANATTAPGTPTGLTAKPVSSSEIDLHWYSDPGATSYTVEWTGNGSSGTVSTGSTGYDLTGLQPGTTYSFQISASNAAGASSFSAAVITITVPAAPTGLAAAPGGLTPNISVSWKSDPGASSYTLERSLVYDTNPNDSNWQVIAANVSGTSYWDTALQYDTSYYYCVSANNAAGAGSYSAPVGATTVPGEVTGFTVRAVSSTQVNVSWNYDPGATSYLVFRSVNEGGMQQVAQISGGQTSFLDSNLQAGYTYSYYVMPYSGNLPGAPSYILSATTLAAPTGLKATSEGLNNVLLTWNSVAGASNYTVEVSWDNVTWGALYTTAMTQYAVTYPLPSPPDLYFYRVVANNATGSSSPTASVMTSDANYVNSLYQHFLGHPADMGGLKYWVGEISSVGLYGVAYGIDHSAEYYTDIVNKMYWAILCRAPDAGASYWVSLLEQGQTEEQVMSDLLGSSEFYQNLGGNNVNGFVNALYQRVLGRNPDSGAGYWEYELNSGAMNRTQVAYAILTCSEFRDDAVEAMYGAAPQLQYSVGWEQQNLFPDLLGRAADSGGLSYWVNSGDNLLQIAAGLASGTEFYNKAQ